MVYINSELIDVSIKQYIKTKKDSYLDVIINELDTIVNNSNDDKSDKRKIRLDFLNQIKEIPPLEYYFNTVLNYYNGIDREGNVPPQLYYIELSGGNNIIIFAKILKLSKNRNIFDYFFDMFLTNNFNIQINFNFKNQIYEAIKNFNDINKVSNSLYGDIDLTYIINYKHITKTEFIFSTGETALNNRIYQINKGFFVGRIKKVNSIPSNYFNTLIKEYDKDNCSGLGIDVNTLYPQMVKESYLHLNMRNNPNCKDYLYIQLIIKNLISIQTKKNTLYLLISYIPNLYQLISNIPNIPNIKIDEFINKYNEDSRLDDEERFWNGVNLLLDDNKTSLNQKFDKLKNQITLEEEAISQIYEKYEFLCLYSFIYIIKYIINNFNTHLKSIKPSLDDINTQLKQIVDIDENEPRNILAAMMTPSTYAYLYGKNILSLLNRIKNDVILNTFTKTKINGSYIDTTGTVFDDITNPKPNLNGGSNFLMNKYLKMNKSLKKIKNKKKIKNVTKKMDVKIKYKKIKYKKIKTPKKTLKKI